MRRLFASVVLEVVHLVDDHSDVATGIVLVRVQLDLLLVALLAAVAGLQVLLVVQVVVVVFVEVVVGGGSGGRLGLGRFDGTSRSWHDDITHWLAHLDLEFRSNEVKRM